MFNKSKGIKMDQWTRLKAKVDFKFKGNSVRVINVKVGNYFLVTNPKHMQHNGIKIQRSNKAYLNCGDLFTVEQIEQLFEEI
jgi:hypothetical protein